MDEETTERVAKAAVEYLISQGKPFEANLLLRARLSLGVTFWDVAFPLSGEGEVELLDYSAELEVPPERLDIYRKSLSNKERLDATSDALLEALRGVHKHPQWVKSVHVSAKMGVADAYPGWKESISSQLQGDDNPLNQATVGASAGLFNWNGLRFRSRSEAVIAAALAKAKVLFFPLPAAVSEVKKYEPDFLVCADGKWGVLEVHGEAFHPSAAKDSERRRWFIQRGIKVVEFYDATRCYREPEQVVNEFLGILKRS